MRLTVFRHAAYDTPWWAGPSSRAGRFNRADQDTVEYLCLRPLGPAAEFLRHNVGPSGGVDDVVLNLWTAMVDFDEALRVDFDVCETYGCAPDELVGDDYLPTQALADVVRSRGATAMIVPSAALPGTVNLIISGVQFHPYLWKPVTPEEVRTGHLTTGLAPRRKWRATFVGSALLTRQSSSGRQLANTTFSTIPSRRAGSDDALATQV